LVTRRGGDSPLVHATPTAPERVPDIDKWFALDHAQRLSPVADWGSMVLAGAPVPKHDAVVVFGRHGGPPVLDSELARLGHIVALAASVGATV
jgi:hypothetical protein